MRHPVTHVAVSGSLLLALAACASPSQDGSLPDPATSSSPGEAGENRSDEPSAASSSSASQSADPRSNGGSPAASGALDLQQRHPNGTVLRVLGISSASTSTTVEIEAVNGFTGEINLNSKGIHLVDDLGTGYNFVDPEQNSRLAVPPGGTLTGTLTFLGKLDQKATSLRLLVNTFNADDTVDIATEFSRASAPAFQIDDIPVPGRA